MNSGEITRDDIQWVIDRVGSFGDDNRAGIERTLHRISVIRKRGGEPVGLVHIDAHGDTARGVFQGGEINDCCVFLKAVLDEAIDPERSRTTCRRS